MISILRRLRDELQQKYDAENRAPICRGPEWFDGLGRGIDAIDREISTLAPTSVWIVQAGYRMDHQVMGVYASKELADAACSKLMEELGASRDNPSWEYMVQEFPVRTT